MIIDDNGDITVFVGFGYGYWARYRGGACDC